MARITINVAEHPQVAAHPLNIIILCEPWEIPIMRLRVPYRDGHHRPGSLWILPWHHHLGSRARTNCDYACGMVLQNTDYALNQNGHVVRSGERKVHVTRDIQDCSTPLLAHFDPLYVSLLAISR